MLELGFVFIFKSKATFYRLLHYLHKLQTFSEFIEISSRLTRGPPFGQHRVKLFVLQL